MGVLGVILGIALLIGTLWEQSRRQSKMSARYEKVSKSYGDPETSAIQKFIEKLESIQKIVSHATYTDVFTPHTPKRKVTLFGIPENGVAETEISDLVSADLSNLKYGIELLKDMPPPTLPHIPEVPLSVNLIKYAHAQSAYTQLIEERSARELKLEKAYKKAVEKANAITDAVMRGEPQALIEVLGLTLNNNAPPSLFWKSFHIDVDSASKVILCTVDVPDLSKIPVYKKKSYSWTPISAAQRRKMNEIIVSGLCIRFAYMIARGVPADMFKLVAINLNQDWFDAATGNPRQGIIASFQAQISELLMLQLANIELKACFNHFKGISTPSLERSAPIKPIFVLNKEDDRIIAGRNVADGLEERTNIAAMPWEDFEHLVRQLFEWEFARNGIEVKVTRASRDRGVDAIMFDPDPLRGGVYVLQAKRYTRLVDVAAVRDLYGTVMNEGANRGILVTTSSYGPDAYEFAKDKPISLVDGPNLLVMLQKHGKDFRIDLDEARKLEHAQHSIPE